jgi:hypothetical protein
MDVAYVTMVVHICCKRLFLMFHLFFQTYVASVFIWMLHMFHTYVASVLSRRCICFAMVFKCFRVCFASVFDACFKCFIYFQMYVASVAFKCFKSISVLYMLQCNPLAIAPCCCWGTAVGHRAGV